MDWNRRGNWPKEIFESVTDPILTPLYILEIRETLRQNEKVINKAKNPNCELGAIRTKFDVLFKLIKLQSSTSLEKILERLEKLEARFEDLSEPKKDESEEGVED